MPPGSMLGEGREAEQRHVGLLVARSCPHDLISQKWKGGRGTAGGEPVIIAPGSRAETRLGPPLTFRAILFFKRHFLPIMFYSSAFGRNGQNQ